MIDTARHTLYKTRAEQTKHCLNRNIQTQEKQNTVIEALGPFIEIKKYIYKMSN